MKKRNVRGGMVYLVIIALLIFQLINTEAVDISGDTSNSDFVFLSTPDDIFIHTRHASVEHTFTWYYNTSVEFEAVLYYDSDVIEFTISENEIGYFREFEYQYGHSDNHTLELYIDQNGTSIYDEVKIIRSDYIVDFGLDNRNVNDGVIITAQITNLINMNLNLTLMMSWDFYDVNLTSISGATLINSSVNIAFANLPLIRGEMKSVELVYVLSSSGYFDFDLFLVDLEIEGYDFHSTGYQSLKLPVNFELPAPSKTPTPTTKTPTTTIETPTPTTETIDIPTIDLAIQFDFIFMTLTVIIVVYRRRNDPII